MREIHDPRRAPWYEKRDQIRSIVIEDGVTNIPSCAFFSCFNLEHISIAGSVTSIGDQAFAYCEKLESVSIPDGVTSIEFKAFRECVSLSSIKIPRSVTFLDFDSVFDGCINLTRIDVDPDNPTYASVEGVVFDKDLSWMWAYPSCYVERNKAGLPEVLIGNLR